MDQRGSDREIIRVLQALRALGISWGDGPEGVDHRAVAGVGPGVDLPKEVVAALDTMSRPAMRALLIEVVWRLRDDLP